MKFTLIVLSLLILGFTSCHKQKKELLGIFHGTFTTDDFLSSGACSCELSREKQGYKLLSEDCVWPEWVSFEHITKNDLEFDNTVFRYDSSIYIPNTWYAVNNPSAYTDYAVSESRFTITGDSIYCYFRSERVGYNYEYVFIGSK